jgi:hypothetical protein
MDFLLARWFGVASGRIPSRRKSEEERRTDVKTTLRIGAVLIPVLLGIGVYVRAGRLSIEPTANAAAQPDKSSRACSLETIEGSYGTSTTGSIVSAGPVGPVADVGVIAFDGDGGVSQTTTVSLNGMIMPNRTSISGSYVVNPDCTGDFSLTLPGPAGPITSTSHFVIVDNGEELQTINTGAGRVLAGDAKRQHPRRW